MLPDCSLYRAFIFSLFLVFSTSWTGWCTLNSSVDKFRNQTVSEKQIVRLARFDHLIRYFCNFSYFEPNHKVSPDFIRALILAESGANPNAISNKKAFGLGQIILTTGQKAGRELAKSNTHFRYVSKAQLKNLRSADLLDPAVNILLVCYLVAKYNYKFDGRLDLVVSAWNAGEYTKSLSLGKHAPYRETENLIGKINAYYIYLLKNRVFP
ncbi:MAG: lytic transglycosylase domain-containing protein [Deltaproteobacteria bacterium]|nr:lytic transglycosylase domain-containing protein [Deltaproteobacteria bacterium]MBW2659963.1 lytic transglycosylase domain-containing protein [Deltaproteobacteria bacterium]